MPKGRKVVEKSQVLGLKIEKRWQGMQGIDTRIDCLKNQRVRRKTACILVETFCNKEKFEYRDRAYIDPIKL